MLVSCRIVIMTSSPYPMSELKNKNLNNNNKNLKNKNKNKSKKPVETDSIYNPDYKFDYTLDYDNGLTLSISRKEYEKLQLSIKQKKAIDAQDMFDYKLPIVKKISRKNLSKSLDRLCGNKKKIYCTIDSVDGQCPHPRLSKIIFTNELIDECERTFLKRYKPYSHQSLFATIKEKFLQKAGDVNTPDLIKILEDLFLLIKLIVDARSKGDYALALVIFTKLRLGDKPILNSEFLKQLSEYFQALNLFGSDSVVHVYQASGIPYLKDVKELLNKYEAIKGTVFVEKIYKLAMYALSLSLFSKVGITFDNLKYSRIEREAIKSKYHLGPDFIHCIIDSLIFLCERGYQCLQSGSMSPLFHSEKSYEEWHDKALEIKMKSALLHNSEAHGFDEFTFRAELDSVIEKGESIVKFAFEIKALEKTVIRKLVNELHMIRCDLVTKTSAREHRMPPFSLLISGDSSIGKSSIMEMMFAHYGNIEKLPTEATYKYTRNAAAKFWDGFTTSQWCIVFDDIAFMHPNKAPQGDPTVMEIIQLINAVPFTPDQADLADKGKTPVKAKLVLASTNTENLNAHYYFSCPSAVQRRFPYIVVPHVKPEYLSDDGKTLDSSKCPSTSDYPDLWYFTVKKVVPERIVQGTLGGPASTHILLNMVNLKDFLSWFNVAVKSHNNNQNKVQASVDKMRKADLCKSCTLPPSLCSCISLCDYCGMPNTNGCACDPQYQMSVQTYYYWVFGVSVFNYLAAILCSKFSLWIVYDVCGLPLIINFLRNTVLGRYLFTIGFERLTNERQNKYQRFLIKSLGRAVSATFNTPPFIQWVCLYLSTLMSVFVIRNIFLNYWLAGETIEPDTPEVCKEQVSSTDKISKATPQGIVSDTNIGSAPVPKEVDRENVWYKNNYELSTFDYTGQQKCSKTETLESFSKRLQRNLVFLNMHSITTNKIHKTGAVCVKGNLYIVNTHAIPNDRIFEVEMVFTARKDGVNENVKVVMSRHNFVDFGQDLSVVEFNCIPPKKDISQYFALESFSGIWNGVLIHRTTQGECKLNYVKRIVKTNATWMPDVTEKHWEYVPQTNTNYGDCGGLVVADAQGGYVIVGMHYAGLQTQFVQSMPAQAAAIPISCNKLADIVFPKFQSQFEPSEPMLSSETAEVKLIGLHHKSPFRWIEKGSCSVYGSLTGTGSGPKSRVEPSIMCDYMKNQGFELKHTKPAMSGWQPKHKALVEIFSMDHKFDVDLLNIIVKGSAKNILKQLGNKVKELMVYDDFTAVNGAAGVTYVDKINRNTSAGFPWKRSKKFYMTSVPPVGGNTDPVALAPEMISRSKIIIDKYKAGQMAHPVFSAALKDEPVTFAKAELYATRVFMGAPVDWSVVVRKYCLSFIRLIQSNKYVFCCAAGTVAQSDEWQDFYDYLTHFGEDRIVAGDYSKFDKRMSAEIIRAAFDLMMEIMKESDMTEEDIKVVKGIALDTAYPMVDYYGDLVQFNGCNPSGHPLTVIINSLANVIYMRYCYYILNPEHELDSFDDNVHLLTYGDDNIMGVSEKCNWFNHTAIADILNTFGVKYTMAEKEAESVPYINIADTSFLKRKWKYCKDMDRYLAALEEDSINKSLMIWVPSKTICKEQQAIAIMNSAVMEYFFHGKDLFEEKRVFFLNMVKELNLDLYYAENKFPTWDDLSGRYTESSERIKRLEESSRNQNTPATFSLLSDLFGVVAKSM